MKKFKEKKIFFTKSYIKKKPAVAAATPSPPPPLLSQISPLPTNDSYDTSIIMILVFGTRLTVPQRQQQQPLKYEAILWIFSIFLIFVVFGQRPCRGR